jgi:hypothetical protein
MVLTAAAKISKNKWSSACATLSKPRTMRGWSAANSSDITNLTYNKESQIQAWEPVSVEEGSSTDALAGLACKVGSGMKHIFSPSQRWPHQHRPSALMMQVPVPQHRGSSDMGGLLWVG